MILRESSVKKDFILYEPEDSKELTFLESFPGFQREGKYFFSPSKPKVVYNLFSRIVKKLKQERIKYTPFVQSLVTEHSPLKDLPAEFKFHTDPLNHQYQALRFMFTAGSCGLLLDPGLGKTKVVLDFIYLMQFKKSIIVCPKPLLYVWKKEITKHRPELSVHIVETTEWEREVDGVGEADVVVINYDKAIVLEEQLALLNANFIGLDEGLIKNYQTERTKSLTRLRKSIPIRCVMSGTLVNNSPIDVFSPIRFVEPALIGESVTRFKLRYALTARTNKNIIVGFRDKPEIKSIIDAACIVMRKEEWLKDLPPKAFHKVQCFMGDEARECYNSLVSNWMYYYEEYSYECDNTLARLGKMLQLVNGFMYVDDVGTDQLEELVEEEPKKKKKKKKKKKAIFFDRQPKIEALDQLIHDQGKLANRRAIIWFNFQAELTLLREYLDKKGIKYISIAGGEKYVGEKVEEFNNDASYRFLLGQARTINYGATILGTDNEDDYLGKPEFSTTVSDEIFYSLNFSLEVFLQQQDRIHRIGQSKECNYWILLTNSDVEQKVFKILEDKVFLNHELLVDISKTVSTLK